MTPQLVNLYVELVQSQIAATRPDLHARLRAMSSEERRRIIAEELFAEQRSKRPVIDLEA